LLAKARGVISFEPGENNFSPEGKGIPRQKPSGKIRTRPNTNLRGKLKLRKNGRQRFRINISKNTATEQINGQNIRPACLILFSSRTRLRLPAPEEPSIKKSTALKE